MGYAEGQVQDAFSKLGGVEENLEERIEVAGGSLVLESDGVPCLPC